MRAAGPPLEMLLRQEELVLGRHCGGRRRLMGPGCHMHAARRLPGVEPRVVRHEVLYWRRHGHGSCWVDTDTNIFEKLYWKEFDYLLRCMQCHVNPTSRDADNTEDDFMKVRYMLSASLMIHES